MIFDNEMQTVREFEEAWADFQKAAKKSARMEKKADTERGEKNYQKACESEYTAHMKAIDLYCRLTGQTRAVAYSELKNATEINRIVKRR